MSMSFHHLSFHEQQNPKKITATRIFHDDFFPFFFSSPDEYHFYSERLCREHVYIKQEGGVYESMSEGGE